MVGIIISFPLNLIPAAYVPKIFLGGYTAHILNYAFLSFMLFLILNKNNQKSVILITFIVISTFSTLIEVLQLFTPNRGFELFDIGSNIIGTIIGIILANVLLKIFFNNKRKNKFS